MEKSLVILVFLHTALAGTAEYGSPYPYPLTNFSQCNMPGPSPVCDRGGILTAEERSEISKELEFFPKKGFCHCSKCNHEKPGPTFLAILLTTKEAKAEQSVGVSIYKQWENKTLCKDLIIMFLYNNSKGVEFISGPDVRSRVSHDCMLRVRSDTDEQLSRESAFMPLTMAIKAVRLHYVKKETCRPKIKLHILIPLIIFIVIFTVAIIAIFIRVKGWTPRRFIFRTPYHAPHEPAELHYSGLTPVAGI